MIQIQKIHHIAIICSDYQRSKDFYTRILGFNEIKETYRPNRKSYKLDLAIQGNYALELFSFPQPPKRVSRPEACGLRHLAFQVANLDDTMAHIKAFHIPTEAIRVDEITGKRFFFMADPDDLPIEFYEN